MDVEFARQIAQLDREKMRQLLGDTIYLYLEFWQVHGYSPRAAKAQAVQDILDGIEATVKLADRGDL